LANSTRVPLMLIASRRQIECAAQGSGYVNNWATEDFAQYVRERDPGGYVVLCRDHGGPWQSSREVEESMSPEEAMKSAKESFRIDIESGFDIIHLDPSIDIHDEGLAQMTILDRLFELYSYCMDVSSQVGSEIAIEVGSEEQTGVDQDFDVLTNALQRTRSFCNEHSFPTPMFVVAQTGTLVKEMSNVGTFDDPFRKSSAMPAEILVPRVTEMCRSQGVSLKEHNADYLSNEALMWHPRLRINAANIAPEFGVAETRHLLHLFGEFQLEAERDAFLEVAFASGKWKKWMLEGSRATDRDKATIAGHYVFSHPDTEPLVAKLRHACDRHGVDLESSLRDAIKLSIMRIMACFNLYPSQ
jgi:hypothetical protein